MSGTPRSKEFDDVYFSVENGLAETRYVFLKGNDLPNAWSGRDRFVIAETGFGTGLNFLAAWKMFEDTAEDGQELDFISVEKFPLDRQEIALYLQRWGDEFDGYLERMLEIYPALIPGFHRLNLNDHVRLTLIVDDVNYAFSHIDAKVDAWFLDGFKPSTNPDMWSETVFENMARLSNIGSSFATFTAAGAVRRGLKSVGFDVEKVPGFGSKRDMSVGRYTGERVPQKKEGE
ncbi:MAG: hypothetical protein CBB87_06360 [Micavibrio sp. TMED27]|nr:hypothetical protein [Micavibrio sp.]OUT91631.1 MAG: hypothetical protein CBB87_06360 [Micavibrio sp. TMED27]